MLNLDRVSTDYFAEATYEAPTISGACSLQFARWLKRLPNEGKEAEKCEMDFRKACKRILAW
jgi:hypothetical protein